MTSPFNLNINKGFRLDKVQSRMHNKSALITKLAIQVLIELSGDYIACVSTTSL